MVKRLLTERHDSGAWVAASFDNWTRAAILTLVTLAAVAHSFPTPPMWTSVERLAMPFEEAYKSRSSLVGCGLVASCQHVG